MNKINERMNEIVAYFIRFAKATNETDVRSQIENICATIAIVLRLPRKRCDLKVFQH